MRTRTKAPKPKKPEDALADLAYALLDARGQTDNPNLADVMRAVVEVTPLIDIAVSAQTANAQLTATDKLMRDNKWDVGKVVLLKSGYVSRLPTKRRRTTTAHSQESEP